MPEPRIVEQLDDAVARPGASAAASEKNPMNPALNVERELAHRGTAFFASTLDELDDAALDGASLLDGWTRCQMDARSGTVGAPRGSGPRVSFADVPAEALDRILGDVRGGWNSRGEGTGLVLNVTDAQALLQFGDSHNCAAEVMSGCRADPAEWATARGAGLSTTRAEVRPAPRWL